MRPAPVTLQSGVDSGGVHVFAADPSGSSSARVPSPSLSAKAAIASSPGNAGPS